MGIDDIRVGFVWVFVLALRDEEHIQMRDLKCI